jgi:hypothetical protein
VVCTSLKTWVTNWRCPEALDGLGSAVGCVGLGNVGRRPVSGPSVPPPVVLVVVVVARVVLEPKAVVVDVVEVAEVAGAEVVVVAVPAAPLLDEAHPATAVHSARAAMSSPPRGWRKMTVMTRGIEGESHPG